MFHGRLVSGAPRYPQPAAIWQTEERQGLLGLHLQLSPADAIHRMYVLGQ